MKKARLQEAEEEQQEQLKLAHRKNSQAEQQGRDEQARMREEPCPELAQRVNDKLVQQFEPETKMLEKELEEARKKMQQRFVFHR